MKERDITFDIMKAMGIILMVVGHAGCPKMMLNFIYTFHMPLFFMISGWFISGNKPNLTKRLKALYWPFLFWNILSLIMQYPLYKLGIYSGAYDLNEYIIHFIRIVTFAQAEPIVGQLWFLKSLFFSYLLVSTVIWINRENKKWHYSTCIICFVMLSIGYLVYKQKGFIFYNIQRELMIPWLLLLGYQIRHLNIKLIQTPFLIFIYFILLILCGQFVSLDLVESKIGNPLILTIYAVIGFIMTYNISLRLQQISINISKLLAYIGRNTMPILILHLICFKVLQFIMSLSNTDVNLSNIQFYNEPHWLLYSIIGIAMPLLLNRIYILILKIKKINTKY